MGIYKARKHDPTGGIDDEAAIPDRISGAPLDGDNIAPLDHHPSILDDSARWVHREHEPVLNRDAVHQKEHLDVDRAPVLLRAQITCGIRLDTWP
jgi:hypothetical protein